MPEQALNDSSRTASWPSLPLNQWIDTYKTLHMWTQIVGKVRLALAPKVNHWWNVPLYVTTRGLTTSPIPYRERTFEVEFDFVHHNLLIATSEGIAISKPLRPQKVAEFYSDFMARLHSLGIEVRIHPMPVEVVDPIRFDKDTIHAAYDPEYANRFWRILVSSERVFQEFRARFLGKCSPVHFFWGSFDLAVTRFSGRPAPQRLEADPITRDAYSHEVISAGWWPGGKGIAGEIDGAAYYAYAAPEPAGFATARVRPEKAFYHTDMHEFLLMYEDMRRAPMPEKMLLDFLQSTYDAGAESGRWDRSALEVAA